MITRLTGILDSMDDAGVVVGVESAGAGGSGAATGLAYQVLLPAFWLARLREDGVSGGSSIGRAITLHTVHYLEGQGQGSSFVPRLLGFASISDRRFFELLTTVDGMGNRKALRTLAAEPGLIAAAISERNIPWLTKLPEVGKKTAEKIVLELHAKVGPWLVAGLDGSNRAAGDRAAVMMEHRPLQPVAIEAVATLVALGEQASEAERLVSRAMTRDAGLKSVEAVLAAVYSAR